MKFSIDLNDSKAVMQLQEERLDTKIAPALKEEFIMLNMEGVVNVVLDLSSVNYADSSGISALLTGHRLFKENGSLSLSNLSTNVRKVIEISQLHAILNIFDSSEDALQSINS